MLDKEYLQGKDKSELKYKIEKSLIQLIDGGYSLNVIDEYLMEQFHYKELKYPFLDNRILSAIRYIEESESLDSDIYDTLSKKAFLSKSRFLHLFKEEAGIDLKNYLLLKKMEKTYYYVTKKDLSITEAAIMSGFSDSSHFAAACKKHYGISFSDFLKAQKI